MDPDDVKEDPGGPIDPCVRETERGGDLWAPLQPDLRETVEEEAQGEYEAEWLARDMDDKSEMPFYNNLGETVKEKDEGNEGDDCFTVDMEDTSGVPLYNNLGETVKEKDEGNEGDDCFTVDMGDKSRVPLYNNLGETVKEKDEGNEGDDCFTVDMEDKSEVPLYNNLGEMVEPKNEKVDEDDWFLQHMNNKYEVPLHHDLQTEEEEEDDDEDDGDEEEYNPEYKTQSCRSDRSPSGDEGPTLPIWPTDPSAPRPEAPGGPGWRTMRMVRMKEKAKERLVDLCRPRKVLVTSLLYVLTALSIITTYAFWDFVDINSVRGNLESPASYLHPNKHGLSRNLRGVLDLANIKADLNNLFDIEPLADDHANEFRSSMKEQEQIIAGFMREEPREETRGQMRGVAQLEIGDPPPIPIRVVTNGTQGAFSCSSERPICPEIDIPGLVGKRKVDLKDAPMSDTEKYLFGAVADDVRRSVKEANEILHKKLDEAKARNVKNVDWTFDSAIDSQAIGLNNYWYLPGGHWKPMDCIPRWKVAIIIPFRDRFYHLPIVLRYLVPMLKRQYLDFSFFIIEQANTELFNRAMLMNVGFLEALNFTDYDCFIIHDVDHVPLDDRNYYGCSSMPRHFVSGADRWNYKLPYENFFGAVSGLTKAQIRRINGFPNVYWGWGGEDDEIWKRVKEVGLEITRMKGPIGHYDVIRHHHKSAPLAQERHGLLNSFKNRYKMDGLTDITYPLPIYTLNTLYTNISVDIRKIKPHYPMPPQKKPGKKPVKKEVQKETEKEVMQKLANDTIKTAGNPPPAEAKPAAENPGPVRVIRRPQRRAAPVHHHRQQPAPKVDPPPKNQDAAEAPKSQQAEGAGNESKEKDPGPLEGPISGEGAAGEKAGEEPGGDAKEKS